jgi:hypothetical protein
MVVDGVRCNNWSGNCPKALYVLPLNCLCHHLPILWQPYMCKCLALSKSHLYCPRAKVFWVLGKQQWVSWVATGLQLAGHIVMYFSPWTQGSIHFDIQLCQLQTLLMLLCCHSNNIDDENGTNNSSVGLVGACVMWSQVLNDCSVFFLLKSTQGCQTNVSLCTVRQRSWAKEC